MSTLTITNTFANATTADAPQVNTNFTDVKTFVDSHCVHKGETALEAKTGSPGWKFQAAKKSGTPDANSLITVTFPVAFAAIPGIIVVSPTKPTSGTTIFMHAVINDGAAVGSAPSTTQFQVRCWDQTHTGITSGTLEFYWIAIGT